ncbi:MAG TPA: ABC transporter ATP-binding protein [Chloroflexota bacterium]|nr:ABC transporter ATP-binding protein [Chloroflexota bacterium]
MFMGPPNLFRQETLKPQRVSVTLGRLAGYFRPYWPALLGVLAAVLLASYSQVLSPALIGQAVDCFLVPSPARCWYGGGSFAGLILLVAGLYLASSAMSGLQFYLMSWAGQHVLRRLRVELFQHLQRLSIGYYTRNEAGGVMSRITNDMDTLQQVLGFALVSVAGGAVLIVWIAVQMLLLSPPYALLSMAVLPLMALTTSWLSGQARKAFRTTRVEIGRVNADLEESIAGVREMQAFGREEANIAEFRATNAANRDANVRAVSYTAALQPSLEALGYVAMAIVAVAGGLALIGGGSLLGTTVSLGLIVAFLGYVQRFNQPIAQISTLWTNVQSAVAGAERIFGLLDEVPDVEDNPRAEPIPPIRGEVVFDDVKAAYTPGELVLRGVSFRAEPGQTIAIVGPTGAGKTTIVNLIPRFYDVAGGRVLVDGHDVRDVAAESLRRQIGVVLQDTFLFSDTVANNIRFGRPDATDEEVVAAARLAHAHDFVERLPQGYQTVLGERGRGLSQGQRQLLAIARAALADPRILILDEATSSVDTRTERQIQRALEELLRGRTSFVIAHRLSTIRHADQVLVVDDGRIVERGTHDELLERRGAYYELYRRQFLHDEAVA